MTNEMVIRAWSTEKLARSRVLFNANIPTSIHGETIYQTSDGKNYEWFEEAVKHEIEWLGEEYDPAREEEVDWVDWVDWAD